MEEMQFKNLDTCLAFQKLQVRKHPINLKSYLDTDRIAAYSAPSGCGLTFNYAAKLVNDDILKLLAQLAGEQELAAKYRALVSGAVMNTGENRMVLHHLMRGQIGDDIVAEGRNLGDFYAGEMRRVRAFAAQVHEGAITGSTGKPFDTVVQIGIGGSDLGPRALYYALKNYARSTGTERMRAEFISNVDPDDARAVLASIDLERTLFIIVSKSGTTQETLTNREFVVKAMGEVGIPGLDPAGHFVAVTSETSPLATTREVIDAFFIDDNIGGRYSATSPVGGVVLSLAFGPDVFSQLLDGAHEADLLAIETDPLKNAAMLDALIGVYERNVLGIPCSAVLPYSQALLRFPAHLQQLDMESNGKSVNRQGEPVSYPTGPVIFGEPGTNGQHSFFQLLHQGTDTIPLQFIGFEESQDPADIVTDGSRSQTKLTANLAAQITAFALGKNDENPNRCFPGNRPSGLIYGEKLTPQSLGALLAHYENKVMFQGLLWNVNSFDQEGVQLGKKLTNQVLSGEQLNPVLAAYAGLLGIRR